MTNNFTEKIESPIKSNNGEIDISIKKLSKNNIIRACTGTARAYSLKWAIN